MVLMTLTDGYCPTALTVCPPSAGGHTDVVDESLLLNLRCSNSPLHIQCKHSLRLGFHLHYGLWRQWWSQNDAPEDFPCCHTVYRPHLPGCVKPLTAKHSPSSILPKARAVMRDLNYPQMQTPVLQSPAPFKGAAHSLAEFYPMPASLDMVQE